MKKLFLILLFISIHMFAQTSEHTITLYTSTGDSVTSGTVEACPYGYTYPSGSVSYTHLGNGVWRAVLSVGEWALYYNGVASTKYRRYFVGEQETSQAFVDSINVIAAAKLINIASHFDNAGNYLDTIPYDGALLSRDTNEWSGLQIFYTPIQVKKYSLLSMVDVIEYGAVGDGVTDNATAISNAVTAAGLLDKGILFTTGDYLINSDITISVPVYFCPGAIIKSSGSNDTLTITSYCDAGVFQVFDTSLAVILSSSSNAEVYPEWWGLNGVVDEIPFQKAIDAVEGASPKINIVANGTYTFHGNLYVGNNPIIGNGYIIINADSTFVQRGSGTGNSEGIFLTKSCAGSTYGIDTTEIYIEGITIEINKTAFGSYNVRAGLFLENVFKGRIEDVTILDGSTCVYAITPIDFYRGVQNLIVNKCRFTSYVGVSSGDGGCWVRNYSTTRPTKNIIFSNCYFESDQYDEVLAISVPTAATTGVVENIKVELCNIVKYSNAPYVCSTNLKSSAGVLRNISYSNCSFYSSGYVTAGVMSSVNSGGGDKINITTEDCKVRYRSNTTSTNVYGIRGFDRVVNCYVENYDDSASSIKSVYNYGSNTLISNSESVFSGNTNSSGVYSVYYGTSVVNNPNLQGKLAGVDVVKGNRFSVAKGQAIRDVQVLSDNYIFIDSLASTSPIISMQGVEKSFINYKVTNNTIVDSSEDASTDKIFYALETARYQIDNNYYYGTRRKFGYENGGITSFKENILDNGTIMNSSYCDSSATPWGFFSDGARMMPIGHRVWRADPDSGSSAGWIKQSAPGTASGDWVIMSNNN